MSGTEPPRPGRRHKLLTEELRQRLPPLYSQEDKGGQAVAYVKFFTPDSNWTWWGLEFDGEDTFFGLVEGHVKELGYFSLSELENVRGPLGLPIERDLYWQPKTLAEIAPELFEGGRDKEAGK
jgi:hypothetical protein